MCIPYAGTRLRHDGFSLHAVQGNEYGHITRVCAASPPPRSPVTPARPALTLPGAPPCRLRPPAASGLSGVAVVVWTSRVVGVRC
jgi:hypothetical protein